MIFDAEKEAEEMRAYKANIVTQKRCFKSALDKHKIQLQKLQAEGLTVADLHRWLRLKQKVKVNYSTVYRWVKKNCG